MPKHCSIQLLKLGVMVLPIGVTDTMMQLVMKLKEKRAGVRKLLGVSVQGCDGTGVELGVELETCVLEMVGEDMSELVGTRELVIELAFGVVEAPVELSTADVLVDKKLVWDIVLKTDISTELVLESEATVLLVECCEVDCTTD